MADNLITKGRAFLRGLKIGAGGSLIKRITYGTVAVDPANIGAQASAETAVTITGVAAGDVVMFFPPASLESGLTLSAARVSGADTVQLRLSNVTGSGVDGASRTWEYVWYDLT
jgi:hypothetical protein